MERIIARNEIIKRKLAGFSLLEMIVAMFIFSLIITATVSVFVASYAAQRKSKDIQLAIEDSRGAIELMAKNIRMGTIDSADTIPGTADEIAFYNYSQNKCIKYKFANNNIEVGEVPGSRVTEPDCSDTTKVSYSMNSLIASSIVDKLAFDIKKSKYDPSNPPNVVGRVTISIKIIGSDEPIQTTVSLRDYNK